MIKVSKGIPVTTEEFEKANQPIRESIFPKSLQIKHPGEQPISHKKSIFTPDSTGGTYHEE